MGRPESMMKKGLCVLSGSFARGRNTWLGKLYSRSRGKTSLILLIALLEINTFLHSIVFV